MLELLISWLNLCMIYIIHIYTYTLKIGVPSAQAEAELHLLGPKNRSKGRIFSKG